MDWCSSVLHFWDFLLDVALAVLRTVFVGPFVATSLFLVQGFVDFICFFFWVLFFVSVSWDPGVSYGFDRLWLGAVVQIMFSRSRLVLFCAVVDLVVSGWSVKNVVFETIKVLQNQTLKSLSCNYHSWD